VQRASAIHCGAREQVTPDILAFDRDVLRRVDRHRWSAHRSPRPVPPGAIATCGP